MGRSINDHDTLTVLGQLNFRFGAGDAIAEMAGLQKAFDVFSPDHDLRQAFSLLGIGPTDWKQKERWQRFLHVLKKYKSDKAGQSGHDRVVTALQENLQSKNPMPVFFTVHPAKQDEGIRVSVGRPVVFIEQDHLTISIPTTPDRKAAKGGRKRR